MTSPRRIAIALVLSAAFAVPSFAQASVGDSLARADQALDGATAAAQAGDAAAFSAYAAENGKASAKAERQAHKAPKVKRAKLLRRSTAQHDANLDAYASLIDAVAPRLQAPVAIAAGASAQAREGAVDSLFGLADVVPEPLRTRILDAIAAFHVDGDLEALFAAFMSEDVINSVRGLVAQTIEMVGVQLDSVLAQLEQLGGVLPPGASEAIHGAISMIQEHLAKIGTLVDELLGSLGSLGGLGGLDGLGSLDGLFGGLFGDGPLCDLLGDFLPIPIC